MSQKVATFACGFNAKAADVDGNGTVDVSDYTGISNIIHTGSVYGK